MVYGTPCLMLMHEMHAVHPIYYSYLPIILYSHYKITMAATPNIADRSSAMAHDHDEDGMMVMEDAILSRARVNTVLGLGRLLHPLTLSQT